MGRQRQREDTYLFVHGQRQATSDKLNPLYTLCVHIHRLSIYRSRRRRQIEGNRGQPPLLRRRGRHSRWERPSRRRVREAGRCHRDQRLEPRRRRLLGQLLGRCRPQTSRLEIVGQRVASRVDHALDLLLGVVPELALRRHARRPIAREGRPRSKLAVGLAHEKLARL